MKNKLQKPSNRKSFFGAILHVSRLIGFTAGLLILLALFHLLAIGLPNSLSRKITTRIEKKGIPLHVESISLSLRRGWVLHNPRVYSNSPDNLEPVLETDKLYLSILPERWTDLPETTWRISISGQDIKFAPEYLSENAPPDFPRTVRQLQTSFEIDQNGLQLDHAELQLTNLLIRVSGQIAFPNKTKQGSSSSLEKPSPAPSLKTDLFQDFGKIRIPEAFTKVSFGTAPEINLQFNIPKEGIQKASAQVTFFDSDIRWKDNCYEQIGGSISFEKQKLSVDSLKITAYDGAALSIFGQWDIPTRNARINLSNSLPAKDLLALLPEKLTRKLDQTGIQPFGKIECDVVAGPAEPEKLIEQINLHMHSMRLRRDEVTLSPLSFDLTRNGHQLIINNVKALANGESVTGNFIIDLNSKAWNASAKGRVQPKLINPVLHESAQDWINRFDFTNRPPNITVDLSKGEKDGTFRMETAVSGNSFSCAGLPFNDIKMTLVYTNRTFSLAPLHITRDGRSFNGTVKLDFQKKLAFFEASTSFRPPVIAHIIAPDYPTVLTNFTFSGALDCKASGRIDYSGGTDHAASGTIRAESVSAKNLTAKSFSSRVEARKNQLIFSNTSAELFNGNAEGSAVFDLRFNDQQAPYRIDVDLTRLNLNQLAQHFSTNSLGQTKGVISATVNIAADASTDFWDSATGHGEVEIEDGQLKDLPVLGGFSKLIRTTLPGFSLFSLTTLYSKYELHDGMFHTDNLELGGTLLSATAHGTYSPKTGLNFIVQAEPLRQTRDEKKWYMLHLWAAKALKEGTAPLFRLLEFELKGPISNPKWRLVNLPKEISQILQAPVQIPGTKKKENTP